jgi:predicted transcriptional regulator
MKYRSRTDIAAQILEVANGGSTKTKIMYGAFLSYAQLKEYLSILSENGLIQYIPEKHEFKTTEKGLKYLRTFSDMDKLVQATN